VFLSYVLYINFYIIDKKNRQFNACAVKIKFNISRNGVPKRFEACQYFLFNIFLVQHKIQEILKIYFHSTSTALIVISC